VGDIQNRVKFVFCHLLGQVDQYRAARCQTGLLTSLQNRPVYASCPVIKDLHQLSGLYQSQQTFNSRD